MYTQRNYKTKKEFKDDIARGTEVTIFQPNDLFNNPQGSPTYSGTAAVEGPHYPQPHKWYAEVKVENGVVVEVK